MTSYTLQIVSPDGLLYDGPAVRTTIRTTEGDVGILARHVNFTSALGMGVCKVAIDEHTTRFAACMGGLVSVLGGNVRIVATTFEWAEDIDIARAEERRAAAEKTISAGGADGEQKILEAAIRRAGLRLAVAKMAKPH